MKDKEYRYFIIICFLVIPLFMFLSCEKEINEKETDVTLHNDDDKDKPIVEGENLMKNGGLEEWISFSSYDIPDGWLCHNNRNVRRSRDMVSEGHYSAKMSALEKGSTARIDQNIPVESGKRIRIRFNYYIAEWQAKGARTYCYFRTQAAEKYNISAEELHKYFDDDNYRILRGGGYGLSYLPHDLLTWNTFDEIITVPPIANYFVFGVNSYYGTTIYVDDCRVTQVIE